MSDTERKLNNELLLRRLLNTLSTRDRDLLTRVYVACDSDDHVRQSLNLTRREFRRAKSLACQHFFDLTGGRLLSLE